MAVGTPANLTAGLSTTDASSFATAAFTPTAGAKLLAWVNVGHRTVTPSFPTSLSGHGVTWTKLVDLTTSNNTWNCSLWEATASGSPSSGTLTFNLAATAESCTWRVVEATGAQVVQTKPLTTSAANPSLTLDNAIGAGGVTLGFLMNNNSTTTITAGSGYTDLGSQQSTGTAPVFKGAAEYRMDGNTVVNFTASGSVVRGMVGVELGPSATQQPLTGAVAASSGGSGSIALRAGVAGTVAAVTAVTGTITGLYPLAGTNTSTTTATGTPTARLGLTGTTAATSATTGSPTALKPLTGTVAATSSTVGDIGSQSGATQQPLDGTVAATTGTSGTIGLRAALTGTVAATSDTTGTPTVLLGFTGQVDATSGTSGDPTTLVGLTGTIEAVSDTNGAIDVQPGTEQPDDGAHGTLHIARVQGGLAITRARGHLTVTRARATLSSEE